MKPDPDRDDLTLFQWIWGIYLREALVPLLLVGLVLVVAYLATHAWAQRQNAAALRAVVTAQVEHTAAHSASVIEQELGEIAVLTDTLRHEAERAIARSHVPQGLQRLARSAVLDPALSDVGASSPLVAQVYMSGGGSQLRVWPRTDTVAQSVAAPDDRRFRLDDAADAAHNPGRRVVWTDVHADGAGLGRLVSCIAPIYAGDTLVGVIGVDVTLERVVSKLLPASMPSGGFALLVARDGSVIAGPPTAGARFGLRDGAPAGDAGAIRTGTGQAGTSNVFRREELWPLRQLIGRARAGTGVLSLPTKLLAAWRDIPSTGWRIVILVPEDRALALVRGIGRELTAIGWLMLAGFVAFYAVFVSLMYRRARSVSRDIAEPLAQIRTMAQSLASGTFEPARPRLGVMELRDTVAELARTGLHLGRANEARLAAERRLRESNRELSTIFSLCPDGLVSFDAAGRVAESNPAFLAMTGLEPESLAGLDRAAFWERLGQQMAAPHEAPAPGQSMRCQLLRPRPLVLECTVARPQAPAERAEEVAYFRDVTSAAELDRAKAQFVATAAHELRTPIAVMLGYTELLQRGGIPSKDQRPMLGVIRRHGEHVAGLIDEMLDLARLDARGNAGLEQVDLLLEPLARDIVRTFRMPGDERIAAWVDSPGAASTFVTCLDADKFRQALGNVLSNAFKYSPRDTPVLAGLCLRGETGQREAGVIVTDQGRGMDARALARVFDRFFRADESGAVPGSGLGMSVVKEIMDLHGGRVEIASTAGHGTAVTLWFREAGTAHPCPPGDKSSAPAGGG